MRVMDDEDLSQLWLRYAAGEILGSHCSFFFCFFFLFVGGFFLVCRFRCSWPGDVMVHPSLRSSNGARRGTMSEGYKCGWVQSQGSEIKVDNGTRRARTVSA